MGLKEGRMNKTLSRWSGRRRVLRRAGRGGQEASCDGGKVGWIPSSHEGVLCGGACQCKRRNEASYFLRSALVAAMWVWKDEEVISPVITSSCDTGFLDTICFFKFVQVLKNAWQLKSGTRKSDGHLTDCRPLEGVWHLRSSGPL